MALKATVFKAAINLADMDRNLYQDLQLTIARHPSENDERMMVRLLAYCLHVDEGLQFTKGLSSDEEPDLWLKSLSDEIKVWIELGQPDEKRIRKASNRADQVVIYSYGGGATTTWWQQIEPKLMRFNNVTVIELEKESTLALALLAERSMRLQCTIQDGELWFSGDDNTVSVAPKKLF